MGWKSAQKLIHHWKILRGDNITVIRGKDKGETGLVKTIIRSQNRVIVEGKNLVSKKHIKQGQGHEGGIFTVEAPLHVSNVQVLDPVTGKPCKVGIRYMEDGSKVHSLFYFCRKPCKLVPGIHRWILFWKELTTQRLERECRIFEMSCSFSS